MIECREIVDSLKTEETNKLEPSKCNDCEDLQKEFAKNPGGKPMNNKGLVLVAITGGSALALSLICFPFIVPAFRKVCLPYVPATTAQVENVMKSVLKNPTEKRNLIDIGSGDGRIVLEASTKGFQSHGVELNPWLVVYSKFRALRLGLYSRATFARQDLWKTDFSKFQNVVIFGVEEMMPQLEKKLESDLHPGSKVVACRFQFPTWKPDDVIGEGIDSVWTYKIAKSKSS